MFPGRPITELLSTDHLAACCNAANVVKNAKLRVRVEGGSNGQPPQYVTETVDLATFPVALDQHKGLNYVDLEMRTSGTYFPMIRLGLARYQEHAVEGAQLSLAVRPAFIQTVPDRALTVQRLSRRELRITVVGPGHNIPRVELPNHEKADPLVEAVLQVWTAGHGDDAIWSDLPGTTASLEPREIQQDLRRWEGCM